MARLPAVTLLAYTMLVCAEARATPTLECGRYALEGTLRRGPGNDYQVVTDLGTLIEFRFRLESPGLAPSWSDWSGMGVAAVLEVRRPCAFDCSAQLVGSLVKLPWDRSPREFMAIKPQPLPALPCAESR